MRQELNRLREDIEHYVAQGNETARAHNALTRRVDVAMEKIQSYIINIDKRITKLEQGRKNANSDSQEK